MPTITAQNIVDKAEIILQDTTNVRWPSTELLGWLNDGQREIVMRKPDAYTTRTATKAAAETRQSLPDTGIQLIDVTRNMGTDGTTPGDAITYLPRKILDNCVRDWHSMTAAATAQHFCFDERDPKQFFLYPPNDGTGYVEIVYSAAPADIAIGATITLDDIYANAILDYMLYRAYLKDADYTANNDRANAAYTAFLTSLGLKEQAEAAYDPNKHPSVAETNDTQ
jgi:hypothetical protein